MGLPGIDPAWIALIGTLCGGLGLKIIEHLLGKKAAKIDDARNIRDELRLEVTAQRTEIKDLDAEVQQWREKYYDLRENYIKMQAELTIALSKFKDGGDDKW